MLAKRAPWRPRPVALTSLIDIIFLLLLFFMLSSTFTRFGEVPLMNACGGAGTDVAPLFLQLRPEALMLNGEAITVDALVDRLSVREAPDETQTLLITLDPAVTSQQLVDLLAVLRGTPNIAVSVLE